MYAFYKGFSSGESVLFTYFPRNWIFSSGEKSFEELHLEGRKSMLCVWFEDDFIRFKEAQFVSVYETRHVWHIRMTGRT